jgi:hypothetical protein
MASTNKDAEIDTPTALARVNDILNQGNPHNRNIQSGHDAAVETVDADVSITQGTQANHYHRLPTIPSLGPKNQSKATMEQHYGATMLRSIP